MKSHAFIVTAAVAIAAASAVPAAALDIQVMSTDAAGEGFNDTTPIAPVGGNPGTTLGAQRMFALQYAADAWGARLTGSVTVIVGASFDTLFGTPTQATLGQAGPRTLHISYSDQPVPGVPKNNVWYPAGLFSQFRGVDANDLPSPRPEVEAQFNSAVDNQQVLGSIDFYYGLDGNNGSDIDFLSVALHEIAHGLGFLDLIDPSTGSLFAPPPQNLPNTDAYTDRLENARITPKSLSAMSNAQRKMAILDAPYLVWSGPAVKANSAYLTSGRRGDGAVEMFAPNTYVPGSSVAHFNIALAPNELMEPYATTGIRDLRLTTNLFKDLGWGTVDIPRCGDANGDANLTSSDALVALRTAVGAGSCSDLVCDVNFSGAITAADALTDLKAAVGITVKLNCPLS